MHVAANCGLHRGEPDGRLCAEHPEPSTQNPPQPSTRTISSDTRTASPRNPKPSPRNLFMISRSVLLNDLKSVLRSLEADLLARSNSDELPEIWGFGFQVSGFRFQVSEKHTNSNPEPRNPKPLFKMTDPACGSGHFVLGAFDRILSHWRRKEPGTNVQELVQRSLHSVHGVDCNP